MRKMTVKRFRDNVCTEHANEFSMSGHIGRWLISMDVSPYSGNYRYTTSFNLWIDNNKHPEYSYNRFIYKTQNYDKFLEMINYIKENKIKVDYDENHDEITKVVIVKD